MTDHYATPDEYAAAVRIALAGIDRGDLPDDLHETAVRDAWERITGPNEDRMSRLVGLLSMLLAGSLSKHLPPERSLRAMILELESRVSA